MSDDEEVIVICGAPGPSPWDDNIEGICVDCGTPIMWRPHAPKGEHVCLVCGLKRVEASKEPPEFRITKETDADLKELGFELKREGEPS